MSFNLDSYVDVAERIRLFYKQFPDGRLTRVGEPKVLEIGPKLFIVYTAKAYRTADDPVPAIGTAWEPFPGTTPYTRDSELMNAETAAWGRAIIAAGIGSKKIASREEVQARHANGTPHAPVPLIGETGATLMLAAAEAAGVAPDKLQLAASHVAKRDVGPCDTKAKALTALGSLTNDEALAVDVWVQKKAAEATPA